MPTPRLLTLFITTVALGGGMLTAHAQTNPGVAKAATCLETPRSQAELTDDILRCVKYEQEFDSIRCPARFPQYVARSATAGAPLQQRYDLCVSVVASLIRYGNLQNFREGKDYVFVPQNGVLNGVSFLANHPNATAADGWVLDYPIAMGVSDRYIRRTRTVLSTRRVPIPGNPPELPREMDDTLDLHECTWNMGTLDCGPSVSTCSGLVGVHSVYSNGYLTCQRWGPDFDHLHRPITHYKTPRSIQIRD